MDLIIDRQEWYHQKGPLSSALYRSQDNKKCCLGFYCLALGIQIETIIDRANPSEIEDALINTSGKWLLESEPTPSLEDGHSCRKQSEHAKALMRINDLPVFENNYEEVENTIKSIFAAHDVNVLFVN